MSTPEYTKVPLDQFQREFKDTSTEVSSVALGGRIVAFSDEFFAEATNLLKVEVSASRFIPTTCGMGDADVTLPSCSPRHH